MTFNAPSFFAGVGTVLVLLGAGFGGGVLMSGVLSDNAPREPNRVERRAAETAAPAITTKPVPVAPAPEIQTATPSPSSEPQPVATTNSSVVQTEAQPSVPVPSAAAPTPALGPQQPVALINPAPNPAEEARAAQAKAQEAKRLAAEKRKAERRKQTAERRRQEQTREAEQRAPAGRSSQDDADDDVRIERPFFMRRERDFGGPPIFRFFGNED